MSEIWEYPLPLKLEAQNHHFWTTAQRNDIFNGYIFGTKHDLDDRVSALETTRDLYIVSKRSELWSTNGLKLDRIYTTPS